MTSAQGEGSGGKAKALTDTLQKSFLLAASISSSPAQNICPSDPEVSGLGMAYV